MKSFHENMLEYKKQLAKGIVQKAYREMMDYLLYLRTYLQKKYPDYSVSSNIYFGYMDMTYFAFFPDSLKQRKLKTGIVFIHETCRFEVWLFGYNKQVQSKYWQMIKTHNWDKYNIVPTTKGVDSIIEYILVRTPDFRDLDTLTNQIENGTMKFIHDIETFLSDNHI
jgi:hypothetical protein